MKKAWWALLLLFTAGRSLCQTYNIKDFGAVKNGKSLNTASIQSAIDRCFADGGGDVVIPAGEYITGTLLLRSNVYLRLLPGAVLQGSYEPADYPEHDISSARKFGTITHDGQYVKYLKALIIADRAVNTGITGEGTVKGPGDGQAFQLGLNKDGKPMNLLFIGCTGVLLRDVQVMNSAQVTISISGCEKVTIDRLHVNSIVNWNCDGLDVDGKDITISNCTIDSEDDALCFKSEYGGKFCENITVTNCVVSSLCNGIKLGTGSRTGFRNISVSNCVIKKSPVNGYRHWKMTRELVFSDSIQSVNTGIVILGVDGGVVENISFSDIIMTDVLSPFFIRVGRRFLNPDQKPSVMRHIRIRNVLAESRSVIPSIIAGLEESPVQDVTLSNIRVSIPITVGAGFFKSFPASVPEDLKGYPENRLTFGLKLPASAFYVRHGEGITLRDITVTYGREEARPAFYFDDTRKISLQNILINDARLEQENDLLVRKNSTKVDFDR